MRLQTRHHSSLSWAVDIGIGIVESVVMASRKPRTQAEA